MGARGIGLICDPVHGGERDRRSAEMNSTIRNRMHGGAVLAHGERGHGRSIGEPPIRTFVLRIDSRQNLAKSA